MADLASVVTALFEQHDLDKDGTINKMEMIAFFNELAAKRPDLSLSPAVYNDWFASIDKDLDGTVSPAEFQVYLESINYQA